MAEAEDGAKALQLIRRHQPQIAVLDLSMPEMNGLEVVARLQRGKTATRCILLTSHAEPANIARAMRNGARGYVSKDNVVRDLARAIKAVADGEAFISPELAPVPVCIAS